MAKSCLLKSSRVNVCLNNLVKSVKCDYPSSEGHEVENLISKNFLERNKGFLVEPFIKPPVTLTFEFTCEIDLKYIAIRCNVGAQQSSGIELSAQSRWSEKGFEYVCSAVLNENENGFIFHRYSEDVKTKFGENYHFCHFKPGCNFSKVKSVRIKIFRTRGSSVPALGKVDIWGVPDKSVPQAPSGSNWERVSNNKGHSLETKPKTNVCVLELNGEKKSVRGWSKRFEVPEDFVDPLTFDMMCQPVILPSGKIIDVSTLESYQKAESQWGRSPNDPFTGVPFTSTSKPIAASDLKARIDKFLSKNCAHPELINIPRTVGRDLVSSQALGFKHIVGLSKLITKDRDRVSSCSATKNSCSDVIDLDMPAKRRKVEEGVKQLKNHPQSDHGHRSPPKNSSMATRSITKSGENSASFQERMEKSLELSLKSTLSSLPSFSADINSDDNEDDDVECNSCKSKDNLFSIPCRHFICRNCLVNVKEKNQSSCVLCKASFKSHDVQRVHVSK